MIMRVQKFTFTNNLLDFIKKSSMFKNIKKLQQYYDEQEIEDEGSQFLSEKDRKALKQKAKKEVKRGSGKKPSRNESEW